MKDPHCGIKHGFRAQRIWVFGVSGQSFLDFKFWIFLELKGSKSPQVCESRMVKPNNVILCLTFKWAQTYGWFSSFLTGIWMSQTTPEKSPGRLNVGQTPCHNQHWNRPLPVPNLGPDPIKKCHEHVVGRKPRSSLELPHARCSTCSGLRHPQQSLGQEPGIVAE